MRSTEAHTRLKKPSTGAPPVRPLAPERHVTAAPSCGPRSHARHVLDRHGGRRGIRAAAPPARRPAAPAADGAPVTPVQS
eukprot:scaffold63753_cov39-Phaeocystis_antarctica.AAC.1